MGYVHHGNGYRSESMITLREIAETRARERDEAKYQSNYDAIDWRASKTSRSKKEDTEDQADNERR